MQLFVIGGSGYIGSVVCERLLADGHILRGLARSEIAAAQLSKDGVEPVRGGLGDADILRKECAQADGVVQIATGGFLIQALESVSEAEATTDVVLDALSGTGRISTRAAPELGWIPDLRYPNVSSPRLIR
jgi:uncharacterized protein YbjT (DUF2867 family)